MSRAGHIYRGRNWLFVSLRWLGLAPRQEDRVDGARRQMLLRVWRPPIVEPAIHWNLCIAVCGVMLTLVWEEPWGA